MRRHINTIALLIIGMVLVGSVGYIIFKIANPASCVELEVFYSAEEAPSGTGCTAAVDTLMKMANAESSKGLSDALFLRWKHLQETYGRSSPDLSLHRAAMSLRQAKISIVSSRNCSVGSFQGTIYDASLLFRNLNRSGDKKESIDYFVTLLTIYHARSFSMLCDEHAGQLEAWTDHAVETAMAMSREGLLKPSNTSLICIGLFNDPGIDIAEYRSSPRYRDCLESRPPWGRRHEEILNVM